MAMAPRGEEHKRDAITREPGKFSRREWWKAARMTWRGLSRDNLPVLAAGVAFFLLLAAFPVLALLLFFLAVVLLLFVLAALGEGDRIASALKWARWPILAVAAMTTTTLTYRFAPCRNQPKWTGLTWGSGSATVVWLLASWLFTFYVRQVGGFDTSYGSLAGLIVVMLWLYLSSLAVLMGAGFDEALGEVMREKAGEEPLHDDR